MVLELEALWSYGDIAVNWVPLLAGQSRGADLPSGGVIEMSVALGALVDILLELREEDKGLLAAGFVDWEVIRADDDEVDDIEILSADGAGSVDWVILDSVGLTVSIGINEHVCKRFAVG